MARNILESSVENASFSIVFQICYRIVTFLLNSFIIRHVGHEVLGIINVRLLLLESTMLFLSREPLMRACLTDMKSHNWAQIINQVWFSIPVTGILCWMLVYIWTNVLSLPDEKYLVQYYTACYVIAVSCIVHKVMTSLVLVTQSYCFVVLKIVLEAIYIFIRTVTFVFFVIFYPNYAIHAFSTAQISSAIALCLMYYLYFHWYIRKINEMRHTKEEPTQKLFQNMQDFKFTSIVEFFPLCMKNKGSLINKNLTILTASFFGQSFVKQVLTEGERYLMTIFPILTFSEQSIYDIVNNLGSLAARLIFRPIEDGAYFYFTQMVKRDEAIIKQDKKSIAEASNSLSQLCKIVTSIGMFVMVFGHTYSHTLLYLYGGSSLVSSELPAALLKCHCIAVLLIAVNGVTECYVSASMNSKQLNRYSVLSIGFSVLFLTMSLILTTFLGPIGFILANCINMFIRIMYSVRFIHVNYKGTNYRPLAGLIPDISFVIALAMSGIVTKFSENYYLANASMKSLVVHVFIGSICLVITSLIWWMKNTSLTRMGVKLLRKRFSSKGD